MPVHFRFSVTMLHFHVTYNSVNMHHKPFLATTRKHLWQWERRPKWMDQKYCSAIYGK